jgi:hypothetical protein
VQTTGRQLGSALGFAILIAVLGTPHSAADFKSAWEFMLLSSLLAGVSLIAVGPAPARAATTPSTLSPKMRPERGAAVTETSA